jgi:hypothetical protein
MGSGIDGVGSSGNPLIDLFNLDQQPLEVCEVPSLAKLGLAKTEIDGVPWLVKPEDVGTGQCSGPPNGPGAAFYGPEPQPIKTWDSVGNLASDCDGADNCYGPPEQPGQDKIEHAHMNGDINQPFSGAVKTDANGDPIKNAKGYYVSQSSFGMDANKEFYVAGNAKLMHNQPLGTIVRVEDTKTGNVRYAMYGDGGGSATMPKGGGKPGSVVATGPHEGSTRLVNELAGKTISPKGSSMDDPYEDPSRFKFRIYENSNPGHVHYTPDQVQKLGEQLEQQRLQFEAYSQATGGRGR